MAFTSGKCLSGLASRGNESRVIVISIFNCLHRTCTFPRVSHSLNEKYLSAVPLRVGTLNFTLCSLVILPQRSPTLQSLVPLFEQWINHHHCFSFLFIERNRVSAEHAHIPSWLLLSRRTTARINHQREQQPILPSSIDSCRSQDRRWPRCGH